MESKRIRLDSGRQYWTTLMQLWPLPFSVALLWGQVADSAAAGFELYLLAGPLRLKEAVWKKSWLSNIKFSPVIIYYRLNKINH